MGFVAFIKSFLYFNPWFEDDIIILDMGLSDRTKASIKAYYSKIIFMQAKANNYKAIDMRITPDCLKKTYYKLEVFGITGYDRIVALDMDMIVLGDLSELFNCEKPFAAVLGYNAHYDDLRTDINSGVFVVNKEYLTEEHYRNILRIAGHGYSLPDQKVINKYFKNKIHHLPKIYNVEKRMAYTKKYDKEFKQAQIIHYVGRKPWEDHKTFPESELIYKSVEEIWNYWYNMEPNDGKN